MPRSPFTIMDRRNADFRRICSQTELPSDLTVLWRDVEDVFVLLQSGKLPPEVLMLRKGFQEMILHLYQEEKEVQEVEDLRNEFISTIGKFFDQIDTFQQLRESPKEKPIVGQILEKIAKRLAQAEIVPVPALQAILKKESPPERREESAKPTSRNTSQRAKNSKTEPKRNKITKKNFQKETSLKKENRAETKSPTQKYRERVQDLFSKNIVVPGKYLLPTNLPEEYSGLRGMEVYLFSVDETLRFLESMNSNLILGTAEDEIIVFQSRPQPGICKVKISHLTKASGKRADGEDVSPYTVI